MSNIDTKTAKDKLIELATDCTHHMSDEQCERLLSVLRITVNAIVDENLRAYRKHMNLSRLKSIVEANT